LLLQHHDERNYHIFYCILAGLSSAEKQVLELQDATDYHYLTQVHDHYSPKCS